jgi:hypothetical protein
MRIRTIRAPGEALLNGFPQAYPRIHPIVSLNKTA